MTNAILERSESPFEVVDVEDLFSDEDFVSSEPYKVPRKLIASIKPGEERKPTIYRTQKGNEAYLVSWDQHGFSYVHSPDYDVVGKGPLGIVWPTSNLVRKVGNWCQMDAEIPEDLTDRGLKIGKRTAEEIARVGETEFLDRARKYFSEKE